MVTSFPIINFLWNLPNSWIHGSTCHDIWSTGKSFFNLIDILIKITYLWVVLKINYLFIKGTLQIFSKNVQKTTPLESCRIILRFQRWYPFGYWTFLRTGNRLWSWRKPENPKANFCGKRALPADPCVNLGANTHSSFIRTHSPCYFFLICKLFLHIY